MISYQASKVRTFEQTGEKLNAETLKSHLLTFANDLLEIPRSRPVPAHIRYGDGFAGAVSQRDFDFSGESLWVSRIGPRLPGNPLGQFNEIIALQNHVIEFKEGQRLIAFQAQFDGIHRQHAIDGEMPPDISQKWDVL